MTKKVQYPQNRDINRLLSKEDRDRIVELTGINRRTLYEQLSGRRKLSTRVLQAIYQIRTENQHLTEKILQP